MSRHRHKREITMSDTATLDRPLHELARDAMTQAGVPDPVVLAPSEPVAAEPALKAQLHDTILYWSVERGVFVSRLGWVVQVPATDDFYVLTILDALGGLVSRRQAKISATPAAGFFTLKDAGG